MSDGTPDSRYEVKAGLQGEVAKNWLMWGHAGVQFGSNEYNRYEGMVGIKRIF